MYRGWHDGGWGFGGQAIGFPWGGIVMAVLFLAVIALLIVLIVRMGKTRTGEYVAKERGINILIERYTRGEIDAETFRAMKAELDSKT
jgi:uncharacterized membrane protein